MLRLRVEKASRVPRIGFGPAALLALWAGLVGISLVVMRLGVSVPTCLFAHATGLPCPTCGGTRAADHLLRGDVLGAFAENPLLVAILLSLLASVLLRLLLARRVVFAWPGVPTGWKWAAVAGLVLLNWAWVLRA